MTEQLLDLITAIGLVVTAIGAGIAAKGVIVSPKEAVNIGVPRMVEDELDVEENLALPAVEALLKSSKSARNGFAMVMVGTLIQLGALLYGAFA